jgi:hypothetical protein
LRKLHPIALDRFCARVLVELEAIGSDRSRSNHERYRAVYRRLELRDEELAEAFDDMRRSTAILRIAVIRRLGLFTDDEFAQFSAETRASVESILGFSRSRRHSA